MSIVSSTLQPNVHVRRARLAAAAIAAAIAFDAIALRVPNLFTIALPFAILAVVFRKGGWVGTVVAGVLAAVIVGISAIVLKGTITGDHMFWGDVIESIIAGAGGVVLLVSAVANRMAARVHAVA